MGKTGREREKERKRMEIIDAAGKFFFDKGYAQSVMDDIALSSGFTKRTVYSYFKNKKELYIAVLYRAMLKLNEYLLKNLSGMGGKTGLEKVVSLGKKYYKFAREYPECFKIIAEYQGVIGDLEKSTELSEKCFKEGEKGIYFLKALIAGGVKDRSISPDINVVETALALWISITGIIDTIYVKKTYISRIHKISINKVINETFLLFEKSLRRSEGE